jgi:NADH-quinone oxidoreductase subunit C
VTAAERAPFVLADAGVTATRADSFGPEAFDVPAASWPAAHEAVRDELGLVFFDWLTASDELTDGFRVVSHIAGFHGPGLVEHLMLRTLVPRSAPRLATLTGLYAGANWHERETYEMFGIEFEGHPNLVPLLLPEGFEGNPLRKEFVLASRVAKPWPGAKEPGESDHAPKAGAPSRRRMLPPGVPDPETWGPRAPGSPDPDPLAAAQASSAPARPRRTPSRRPSQPAATEGPDTPAGPTEETDTPQVAATERPDTPAGPAEGTGTPQAAATEETGRPDGGATDGAGSPEGGAAEGDAAARPDEPGPDGTS